MNFNSFKYAVISKQNGFEIFLFLIFLVYVGLCLTPSSYGLVLNMFGHAGEGLLWGHPRSIRSDEWAVWTPYFQSVVNNDFGRFNQLSMYGEDFRGFSALPIKDWGLLFKPLMWPFLMFPPAYAFSMHHGLIILVFIIGWKKVTDQLLVELNSARVTAMFSLLLFFSGFVQGWWTTLGPLLAVTPWLFLSIISCERVNFLKCLGFSYISTVWMLSHTYPPIIISSAYAGLALLACFRRSVFNIKTLISLCGGGLIALVVVYLYLHDAIEVMSQTIYPGKRISHGGEASFQLWLSTLLPYINNSNYKPLLNDSNICELGVITSYLPLMAVIFGKYKNFTREQVTNLIILSIVIILASFWMLMPIPDVVAKMTLLDRVPGKRMVWALGLAWNFLALYWLGISDVRFTAIRISLFAAAIILCYSLSLHVYNLSFGEKSAWEVFAAVLIFPAARFFKGRYHNNKSNLAALICIAAFINFIYFGMFNPGQSAKPIFSLKESSTLDNLKIIEHRNSRGWLIVTGYPGAILQGLELNSVTHVLMLPKLDFFRKFFPDMDEKSFNKIFNRYAHIQLANATEPYSPQADVIRLPVNAFSRVGNMGNSPTKISIIPLSPSYALEIQSGGYIDSEIVREKTIVLTGWGMISNSRSEFLSGSEQNFQAKLERIPRMDVVNALSNSKLMDAGFRLSIELPVGQSSENFLSHLCLYSKDSEFGIRRISSGSRSLKYQCKK